MPDRKRFCCVFEIRIEESVDCDEVLNAIPFDNRTNWRRKKKKKPYRIQPIFLSVKLWARQRDNQSRPSHPLHQTIRSKIPPDVRYKISQHVFSVDMTSALFTIANEPIQIHLNESIEHIERLLSDIATRTHRNSVTSATDCKRSYGFCIIFVKLKSWAPPEAVRHSLRATLWTKEKKTQPKPRQPS